MKKIRTDRTFLKKPIYPGGPKAMGAFLNENLKYPKEALESGTKGIVQVKITIDADGKVIQTEVMHGIGHGCDEEAQRVARLLKFQVPKNRGVKPKFFKKINIRFGIQTPAISHKTPIQLPHTTPTFSSTQSQITSITYTITVTKKG